MERKEIVTQLRKYFKTQELVCPHTFQKFGDNSWDFIETRQLETILVLRTKILKAQMLCNNYHSGGTYTQRGTRCNLCQLVKDKTNNGEIYLTAHANCGDDFDVDGMTAEQARQLIKDNQHLLPYPVRIEKGVAWLHIDTRNYTDTKVIEFNA